MTCAHSHDDQDDIDESGRRLAERHNPDLRDARLDREFELRLERNEGLVAMQLTDMTLATKLMWDWVDAQTELATIARLAILHKTDPLYVGNMVIAHIDRLGSEMAREITAFEWEET